MLWVSSGSSGVAGFIGLRPGGRRDHPDTLGSLGCVLGVIGFILGSWVHWSASWESSGSSGTVGLIGVRLGVRRVNLGSLGCALGVVGFVQGRWGH